MPKAQEASAVTQTVLGCGGIHEYASELKDEFDTMLTGLVEATGLSVSLWIEIAVNGTVVPLDTTPTPQPTPSDEEILQSWRIVVDNLIKSLEQIDPPPIAVPFHEQLIANEILFRRTLEGVNSFDELEASTQSHAAEIGDATARLTALGNMANSVCPEFQQVIDVSVHANDFDQDLPNAD